MKKTKLSLILSGLMIATAVCITACQKKTTTTTTPDTSTVSATDNQTAQQNSSDIVNIGSESIDGGSLSTFRSTKGASVLSGVSGSVSVTVTGTKQIQVTFNTFVGYDGHTRNGTIQYDWSQSINNATYYKDSGLVLNITTPSKNYTVDGNNIQINSKTIKNIGRINGTLTWDDNSNITIIKANNGGTIQWQASWVIALLNTGSCKYTADDGTGISTQYAGVFSGYGSGTPFINWPQAIISVSGTFGGTASDGETYTGNISAPLVLNFNCTPAYTKYLYVAGTLNFTPTGKTTRTINYGTGTCDLTYVISIGSFSVTITL